MRLLRLLLRYNNANRKNMRSVVGAVAQQFYENRLQFDAVALSLQLVQRIVRGNVPFADEPQNFFYFHGLRCGIRLADNTLKWVFERGLTFLVWFRLERCESREEPRKSSLLYLRSSINDQEIEIYVLDDKIHYRTSIFWQKPQFICQVALQQWNFLAVEIESSKDLFQSKYRISFYLNGQGQEGFQIDFPKINSGIIKELYIGKGLLGQIASVYLAGGGSSLGLGL